jgi:uncharacterized protein with HEPN domain
VSERDQLYLEHVLQAIALIERFTATGRAVFFGQVIQLGVRAFFPSVPAIYR